MDFDDFFFHFRLYQNKKKSPFVVIYLSFSKLYEHTHACLIRSQRPWECRWMALALMDPCGTIPWQVSASVNTNIFRLYCTHPRREQ